MTEIATATVTSQVRAVLREAVEGPQHAWSYFTDSDPAAGLLGTVAPLGAEQASRPLGPSGTSIAGHMHHLAFSLAASAGWIRGERPSLDWSESWRVRTVTDAQWADLKTRLHQAWTELDQAIEQHALDGDEAFGGAVGAVAHAAYHLAAIRQKVGIVVVGR
ncbi:MAG TPA: DinB family protein [Gemmatimonadales bacterium]|nr:DinB family protein [Gemmatimonadales bacterium]